MAPRHWTIVVIPPGNEQTRSFVVTPRTRKMMMSAAGTACVVVLAAVFVLTSPYATPAGRVAAAETSRLRARLAEIDTRLLAVSDTLAAIGAPDTTGGSIAAVHTTSAGGSDLLDGMLRRATALAASFRAVSDTLTASFEKLARTPSIMPTTGWLSSQFSHSRYHPVLHESRAHEGIDVGAPMGAPIVAPASGTVRSVEFESSGYGRTFEIDHGDGIVTRFAHCSRIVVRVGQTVTRGQLIATVGNSGLTTGPHLHYEIHVNGKAVDPLRYVVKPAPTERLADAESDTRP